jgi:hypothetical protein
LFGLQYPLRAHAANKEENNSGWKRNLRQGKARREKEGELRKRVDKTATFFALELCTLPGEFRQIESNGSMIYNATSPVNSTSPHIVHISRMFVG